MKKPKRKFSFYLIILLSILFAISVTNNNINFINEVMFGLILLVTIRITYDNLNRYNDVNNFEIETHYDKLNSVILGIIGIVMISFSVMNPDFMTKLNLEWINFLIIGIFMILSVLKINKSLKLISKESGVVQILDYELEVNSETKQIKLFNNKMIISKNESENYEFTDLILSKEKKAKLEKWIKTNIPNSQIEVIWNG